MSDMNDRNDARRTAETVLAKDRRRIRNLAVLSIALWIAAALLIPSVYLPMGAKLRKYKEILDAENPGAASLVLKDDAIEPSRRPPTPEELPGEVAKLRQHQWIISQIIFHEWMVGAMILALALSAGVLASVTTVMLALTVRRVTLRQVSDQLAEISFQLQKLRQA